MTKKSPARRGWWIWAVALPGLVPVCAVVLARPRRAGPDPAGPCPDLLGGASFPAPSTADRIFSNLAFAFSRRGGALYCAWLCLELPGVVLAGVVPCSTVGCPFLRLSSYCGCTGRQNPWPADGSHGCGLLSTRGAAVGGLEGPPCPAVSVDGCCSSSWRAPWLCCGGHGCGSSHPGGPWLGGWPSSLVFVTSSVFLLFVLRCPLHVSLLWRCLCDYTGGTQVLWRRLGSRNLSIAPHDTGGVAALGSLGCAAFFDYVDDAVSWFGLLGDALRPCRWHTGVVVSSRLVCPFDCIPRHRWCRGVVYSRMRGAF